MSSAECPHCGQTGGVHFHCDQKKAACRWVRCDKCKSVIGQWSHICGDNVIKCRRPSQGVLSA